MALCASISVTAPPHKGGEIIGCCLPEGHRLPHRSEDHYTWHAEGQTALRSIPDDNEDDEMNLPRCGATTYTIDIAGAEAVVCARTEGHTGPHETSDGGRWTERGEQARKEGERLVTSPQNEPETVSDLLGRLGEIPVGAVSTEDGYEHLRGRVRVTAYVETEHGEIFRVERTEALDGKNDAETIIDLRLAVGDILKSGL